MKTLVNCIEESLFNNKKLLFKKFIKQIDKRDFISDISDYKSVIHYAGLDGWIWKDDPDKKDEYLDKNEINKLFKGYEKAKFVGVIYENFYEEAWKNLWKNEGTDWWKSDRVEWFKYLGDKTGIAKIIDDAGNLCILRKPETVDIKWRFYFGFK